jgi:hypothetical protein
MVVWETFRESITLDIFDINFLYGSEAIGELSLPGTVLPRPGVAIRIASFLGHMLKSLGHPANFIPKRIPAGKFLFCFGTSNQRNSLAPIVSHVDDPCLVGLDFLGRLDLKNVNRFPVTLAYLVSLFFFPLVLYKYFKTKGYRKKTFQYVFDSYWLVYGCYIISRLWLRRVSPPGIAVANDHNVAIRSLIRAARMEHIPTFYVQHASVTDKFPPLSFDFALLEGMDALLKYERAGASPTKVFLIGMLKADAYSRDINTNMVAEIIGICTNLLDPVVRVDQLCQQIRREFPNLRVSLRPHPADRRREEWIDLAKKYQFEFSDSKVEHPFDFMKRVDVIIAGDSNIHLEAALMNVFPLYYDFEQIHRDHYGFQHNGMVEFVAEPQLVCDRLKELLQLKPSIRMKARSYCATVGTPYDGRSSELASAIANDVVSNGQVNMSRWQRIAGVELEAYELAPAPENSISNSKGL